MASESNEERENVIDDDELGELRQLVFFKFGSIIIPL
jgi:hypothetical protein